MDMGIFWTKFKEIYFPHSSGDLDTSKKRPSILKTPSNEKGKLVSDNLKDNNYRKTRLNSKRKVRLQILLDTFICLDTFLNLYV